MYLRTNKITIHILLILLSTGIMFSCKKQKNPIPDVYVNFSINISSTLYIELSSIGGWVYLTGGYKGIVVYRKSVDEFVAFDRACPHDWEIEDAYIEVEPSGLVLKCHHCGSEYLITDGSVVNSPSSYPLKQYNTYYDGQILRIYN